MMDTKITPVTALSFFKETRIGNECNSGQTTIQLEVHIPSITGASNSFHRNSRPRRRVINTRPTLANHEGYSKAFLASSGSIHFGTAKTYPRSIVWRVLQDRKVLELRSADLCKIDEEKEATINIQLVFLSPINNNGVALVDAEEQGFLNLFILTKESELLTFTLRREFFSRETASEEDIRKWCKVSKPASFSISTPYHLISTHPLQVVVSLGDGRLLNLTRKSGDDGTIWHETAYGDGQWTTFLGSLVPWQGSNAVKYDGSLLDAETAVGLALSPDRRHAYAVCLNHTLKVWSLDTAKSVFSVDLLGQPRDMQVLPKMMLDPGALHRVQVFQAETILDGDEYYVMTFSPHGVGQFKIWGIRDPSQASRGIRDMFPEYILLPPDPDPSLESKAIWKVADFKVNNTKKGSGIEIWVLMRSNKFYRLYTLAFELESIGHQWRNNWLMTTLEMPDQAQPSAASESDPEDLTDPWLDLLFYPGRYPQSVLETALAMYSSARNVAIPDQKSPYQARLWSAITSRVQRQQSETGNTDFQKYRRDINQEWAFFGQDVRDLNNSRWGVISLAFDDTSDMPWLIFADGYSAIRKCSKLEIIAHNTHDELHSTHLLDMPSIEVDDHDREAHPAQLAVYISAAATFRQSFACPLQQTQHRFLSSELWQQPFLSIPNRMQSFYENFNFEDEIGNNEIDDLESGLGAIGGFGGLDTNSFLAIINELPKVMQAEVSGLVSTQFGRNVLVSGAQQMIYLYERILLDLLILVVFLNAEVDREERSLQSFDGARVYSALLDQLRKYQMMQWLARNIRQPINEVLDDAGTSDFGSRRVTSSSNRGGTSTILEDLFVVDVKPQECSEQSQSEALTRSIQDILQWATGGNDPTITLDIVLVHVQCNLLAKNNLDLAIDFLLYQPSTAWAEYIKGRLYLARYELAEANICFKKAAFKLSRPVPSFDYHNASHNLLSSLEAAHFGNGLDSYYTHILNLFETAESPSYVASYANLALLFTHSSNQNQTTSLLGSAFRAYLSISNFESAYSALIKHPDDKTLLPSLIDTMIAQDEIRKLITFPFPAKHHPQIEAIILQKARATPVSTSLSSPRFYEILSAWRLARNNPRGAATALLERLERLCTRASGSTARPSPPPQQHDELVRAYLSVINLLSCAAEQWMLIGGADCGAGGKRRVVTIEELRKRYQDLLDEMSVIDTGKFEFGVVEDEAGGEAMDVL